MKSRKYEPKRKISAFKKLNPCWWIRNDDDPLPPGWFRNDLLMWLLRNPLHNFMWYVIGIADRSRIVIARNPSMVFVEGLNWSYTKTSPGFLDYLFLSIPVGLFVAGLKATGALSFLYAVMWVLVPFPFISYKSKRIKFYIGWRPDSGAFGFKLVLMAPAVSL